MPQDFKLTTSSYIAQKLLTYVPLSLTRPFPFNKMSVFSKFSASKKQAQKLQEEKKQKAKADSEPQAKYMHTPKHAYVDALNCVAGPSPGNTRESIREAAERAAERRKSRPSPHSSRTTMNGLHSAHSSSSGFHTMGSWEARRNMMQKDQLQICGGPIGIGSARRSYQSSPLASCSKQNATIELE